MKRMALIAFGLCLLTGAVGCCGAGRSYASQPASYYSNPAPIASAASCGCQY